jgi:hypothetical protein
MITYTQPAPPQVYNTQSIYDLSEAQKKALFRHWLSHFLDKKGLPNTKPTQVDYSYVYTYCQLLDANLSINKIDSEMLKNLAPTMKTRTIIVTSLGVQIFCPYNGYKLIPNLQSRKENKQHRGDDRRKAYKSLFVSANL